MEEDRFLKCIVDGNRRKILRCLDSEERCVNEVIESTELEQTLVSFHLKALKKCGLVSCRREGKKMLYRVSNSKILDTLKRINELSYEIKNLCECDECDQG